MFNVHQLALHLQKLVLILLKLALIYMKLRLFRLKRADLAIEALVLGGLLAETSTLLLLRRNVPFDVADLSLDFLNIGRNALLLYKKNIWKRN